MGVRSRGTTLPATSRSLGLLAYTSSRHPPSMDSLSEWTCQAPEVHQCGNYIVHQYTLQCTPGPLGLHLLLFQQPDEASPLYGAPWNGLVHSQLTTAILPKHLVHRAPWEAPSVHTCLGSSSPASDPWAKCPMTPQPMPASTTVGSTEHPLHGALRDFLGPYLGSSHPTRVHTDQSSPGSPGPHPLQLQTSCQGGPYMDYCRTQRPIPIIAPAKSHQKQEEQISNLEDRVIMESTQLNCEKKKNNEDR